MTTIAPLNNLKHIVVEISHAVKLDLVMDVVLILMAFVVEMEHAYQMEEDVEIRLASFPLLN